jgi:hypothetical protein
VGLFLSWRTVRVGSWRDAAPWLALTLFAFVLALDWVPIFDLPIYNRFRWPFKFLLYGGWFATISVTVMLSSLERRGSMGQRTAPALLTLALCAQVVVDFLPATIQEFARRRVTEPAQLLADQVPVDGRVAAVQPGDIYTCNLFTFNYATLTGHHSVSGYDPLLSIEQYRAALTTGYNGFIRRPIDNQLMGWLVTNGVRFVFAFRTPETDSKLEPMPNLRLFLGTREWSIYRLEQTFPLAYTTRPEGWIEEAPSRFRGNVMEIDVRGLSGRVVLNIFPLPDLRFRLDGGSWRELGAPDGKPFVTLPPEARQLEVTLAVPSFRWTIPTSLLALLGSVGLCFRAGRTPGPATVGSG